MVRGVCQHRSGSTCCVQVVEFSGLSRAAVIELLREHDGDPTAVLNHLFP